MILSLLTNEDLKLATQKSAELGALKKSITKGDGNIAAHLGEIAACRYLGVEFGNNTYNYDLIYNGLKIDVKTKRCTSSPRPKYLVSVAAVTRKQDCDIYLFTRVLIPKYDRCWLLGWMPSKEYFEQATFGRKGAEDPTGGFGWTFKEDCYNLPIERLKAVDELIVRPDSWEGHHDISDQTSL